MRDWGRAGFKFIYAGNHPGRVGRGEHTHCPGCGDLLIERYGCIIRQQHVAADGCGASCGAEDSGRLVLALLLLLQGPGVETSTTVSRAVPGVYRTLGRQQ